MNTYRNAKAEEFIKLIQADPEAILVDVRTEAEFKGGHIPGAINIPSTNKDALKALDKSKHYYLHCRVGGRSAMACHTLASNGFESIVNLNDDFEELKRLMAYAS